MLIITSFASEQQQPTFLTHPHLHGQPHQKQTKTWGKKNTKTVELLANAKTSESGSTTLLSDMDNLERSIIEVQKMLERVSEYVDNVLAGTVPANNTVGRYLMDTVSIVPKVDAAEFEKMFNSHLQDLLMVIYLANMTRTQLAVAKRLEKLM